MDGGGEASVDDNHDGGGPSDKRIRKGNDSGYIPFKKQKLWTTGEIELLVSAVGLYGRRYKEMSTYMKGRSASQIASYMRRNGKAVTREANARKHGEKKTRPTRSGPWCGEELSLLVEGHAIYYKDYELIAMYVKTRNPAQVRSILESGAAQYKDESAFDLSDHFAFPIELYHVLNVAAHEGFDHILSWSEDGDSVEIQHNGK